MQSDEYPPLVKEHMELMKGRLAFLPEIRQEIQSVLALPQNKELPPGYQYMEFTPYIDLNSTRKIFSRLREVLSRLDNLPSPQEILNESDQVRLSFIFGELEKIKLSARIAILALQTNFEAGIQNWGFSSHDIWAVDILPFFYIPARLVVVRKESSCQAVFGICLSQESVSTSVLKMELPKEIAETFEEPFRNINFFQTRSHLIMDGIGYELSTISRTSN
ncbi:MAG TPA: hypothetical protein VN653_02465, partial [Anaerolineales bacterium]|nr:hypothetical protein [Anaerolineales bacterium]